MPAVTRLKRGTGSSDTPCVLTAAGAPTTRGDAGLSLVEIMIAMALFVVGSLSLLSVLVSSTGGTFDNRARLTAANLAAADIDDARSTEYSKLLDGETTTPVEVDGRTYSVVREVRTTVAAGNAGTSSCVASGSARQLHKRVSTAVSTAFRGRTAPVRADTIVRAPVFDPNSDRGALAILVMNRSGAPLPGLTVTVASKSSTTDVNGCSFFDDLLPGTYTVTVVRAGSVTRDGRTPMTKAVAVHKGQITSDSLRVGTGLTVTVRARAFTGSTPVTGYNLPSQKVALSSPDRSTPTAVTHVDRKTMTGSDLVWSSSVYPSPAGYEAYIGACSDVARFDSEPATSPSVDLPLSPVSVHLKASGSAASLKSVTATWVPAGSSPPCAERLSFVATTSSGCSGTADYNGNSCKLDIALPPGTWALKVSGSDGASTTAASVPKSVLVGARAAPVVVELSVS